MGDPEDLYSFVLQVLLDDPVGGEASCELICALPLGYPVALAAEISVVCPRINREDHDRLMSALQAALPEVGSEEMQVLVAVDWIRDNAASYFSSAQASAQASKASKLAKDTPSKPVGFMREWCSFVSFYKDSYISGPNRFEVMMALATGRGLKITGIGIAGKPGGMVCEGEQADVIAFMELMRTDFFETLNPRGRKLTTRLQERWPLDGAQEMFEAAEVEHRLKEDAYKSKDRELGLVKKTGAKERFEEWEAQDRALLDAWRLKTGRTLSAEEVSNIIAAGPPAKCTTPNVYFKCGCEEPPTLEEINAQRLFQDYTIFQGKTGTGYDGAYQEAGKLFKELGRMDGFDAMFAYRFS